MLAIENTINELKNLKIICVSEHWLNENEVGNYNFANYYLASIFFRKRYIHGGVCIYAHKSIKCSEIKHIKDLSVERVCELTSVYIKHL